MAERKEYRSALRSRRYIREAFLALLKEKQLERITVTDVVNRADINRSTFYAHYADVKALVEEIQKEFVENSVSMIKNADFMEMLQDPLPFVRKWIEIANENRELYTFFGKAAIATSHVEQFKLLLVEKAINLPQIPEDIRNQKNFEIRVNFFVGGVINVYQQYLVGNLDATTDEIVADIAELIKESAPAILKVTTAQ